MQDMCAPEKFSVRHALRAPSGVAGYAKMQFA